MTAAPKFYSMDDSQLEAWILEHNTKAGELEECGLLFDDVEWFDEEDDEDDRQTKRDELESIAEQIWDCIQSHAA
jgi:hypothetical protein